MFHRVAQIDPASTDRSDVMASTRVDAHGGVTFHINGPILEVTGHGAYTTEQIAAAVQAAKQHPGFRSPALLLIDIRDSQIHYSFEDVRAWLALLQEQLAPVRIAFGVAGEAREHLARIYQSRAVEMTSVPVEVFTDLDAARGWLTVAML
jgi:hypothetical protein